MSNFSETAPPLMDTDELIDGQRVRAAAVVFLVIATLAMFADGFDFAVMGYVAPELIKAWHLAPSDFVPAFSAGVFGMLFGAPLLGFVGDRYGRKTAIVLALLSFGALTMISMAATSLNQFVVLRFLAGLGLGGLSPNAIALAAEVAPKRLRGAFVIIVNFGVPAGIAAPGWVSAFLVPRYGWPVLLFVGGALAILIGLGSILIMQESIKYLVQHGGKKAQAVRLARVMRPDLRLDPDTRFVIPAQSAAGLSASPAKLFAGGLAFITPIFWIVLAANQFTNFFTVSWLPILLRADGVSTAEAGISASMFPLGGIIGGFVLMFVIDRFGAIPVLVLFLLGAPMVAAIGFVQAPPLLYVIIASAGFCVTGNNFGMNAVLGIVYPTPVRSKGAGWAQAMGRIGALGAQIIGGMLLARHLPVQDIILAPAFSLLVGAAAAGCLVLICFRKFSGFRLREGAVAEPAVPLSTRQAYP